MGETRKELVLIPKSEKYVQYMLEIIMKLPRTEKYSIGTEYKQLMYRTKRCTKRYAWSL